MLSKGKRVNKDLFDEIIKKGLFFSNRYFSLRFLKNGLIIGRFSVAVPKKVEAKAVARNKAKRRTNAALRELSKTHVLLPFDTIIFPKKEAKNLDFSAFKQELTSLLKQAGILS